MNQHRNRYYYAVCMFLVAALSIGWQPVTEAWSVSFLMENVGREVEAICLMEENNTLFHSTVSSTSFAQRQENQMRDEEERRRQQALQEEYVKEMNRKEAAARRKKRRQEKLRKKREMQKSVPASARTSASRKILWRIVEAEAGDQDLRGRRLVANVILNRVKSKEFPNTVRKVVFSPHQFSPVSNGSYYRVKVSGKTKKAVDQALRGVNDSRGALYFMWRAGADSGNASWFDRALKKLFTYGCHEFFR